MFIIEMSGNNLAHFYWLKVELNACKFEAICTDKKT